MSINLHYFVSAVALLGENDSFTIHTGSADTCGAFATILTDNDEAVAVQLLKSNFHHTLVIATAKLIGGATVILPRELVTSGAHEWHATKMTVGGVHVDILTHRRQSSAALVSQMAETAARLENGETIREIAASKGGES